MEPSPDQPQYVGYIGARRKSVRTLLVLLMTIAMAATAASCGIFLPSDNTADIIPDSPEPPSSPEEEGESWVFKGTGSISKTTDTPKDAEVCSSTSNTYVLSLHPGGAAQLDTTSGFRWIEGKCSPAQGDLYDGIHDNSGEFTIWFPGGTDKMITGDYDRKVTSGSGGYDANGFGADFSFHELKRE